MKIRNFLYVLLFAIFAISCVADDGIGNGGDPNEGGGKEEPSQPSQPSEPAYIRFSSNYVVADYNGGERSVAVSVNTDLEWEIVTWGDEWFSAERVDNNLVVTFSECSDKLEREGTITVTITSGEESVFDTITVLQIGTDTHKLIYEVETTEPNQRVVAAPILTLQNGGKMTVDFGDGSEPAFYESQRVYKEYAEPGLYTIVIEGEDIHNLEFAYNDTICPELKRIHSWGKMGYKNAANMCKGCINLESIPADVAGSFENVISFERAFLGCEKLTEIPEGLLQHAVKAKKFANCFRYTASISEIPENLFANCPLAEEFYFSFYGTGTDYVITHESLQTNAGDYLASHPAELKQPNGISEGKLRSVPEKLFANCPNATRFEYVFGSTAITTVPEKIFENNTAATNYEGVCYACTNFASLPANLMKNATSATNIKYMFAGCTSLTEIPVAMFENCTEITNLEYIFSLTSVQSVKKGIFKGLSNVKTVGAVFYGCTALTDVEGELFEGLTAAKSFRYCFANCTSLRSVPANLLSGMSAAYDFENTFANTALESVPESLFDGVRDSDMADYSYIFWKCKNLKTVPAKLFDHVTKSASDGFECLFVDSGIETIPAGLFATCTKVGSESFVAAFYGCPELHTVEGSIFPETTSITRLTQLFANCPKLENLPADLFKPLGAAKLRFTQTFENCTSLKTLPEGLFSANTKATHFTATFVGCTALESVPASLLASCGEVTYVDRMFANCTALKAIPETLFAGTPKITSFEETFTGCTSLEALPEGLFSAIGTTTSSVTFSQCFCGCSSLKSLPAGLFDTVRRINYIDNCFNGCTSLAGESPYTMVDGEKVHLYERTKGEDFLTVPSSKSAHLACFAGCTGLSDYADMPEDWKQGSSE